MTRKLTLFIFILVDILTIIPQSCENNNEFELYKAQLCDTSNITWNSKISIILKEKCVKCHGEDISYNNVRHDSYASELIVVNDGRLRRVINTTDAATRMPKNEQPLDSCMQNPAKLTTFRR